MILKKKHIAFIFLYWFLTILQNHVHAQDSSSIKLPETIILESRYSNSVIGAKKTGIDSTIKKQFNGYSLADLFSFTNLFFVKSYGVNGIATSSVRGANASQSMVNWNGFNINHPMLGQSDLSLLPSFFFNDVNLIYGSWSANNGSSAIGSSIMLKNKIEFKDQIKTTIFSDASTNNAFRQGFEITISTKKWISSSKLFYNHGKNNFQYYDSLDGNKLIRKQTHNKGTNIGFMQENNFLIGKYQKISLSAWIQQNNRELPPLKFNAISKQNQLDAFFRTTLNWQYIKDKTALFFRLANFIDQLDYHDSIADIHSKSKSIQQIAEFDYSRRITSCIAFTGGLHATLQDANNNNYKQSLDRYAIYSSLKLNCPNKTFQSKVDVRKEFIPTKNLQPFIWNVGLEWKPLQWFKIYANTGKVFRLPTLNDWFWQPGGNPNLKHEEGYSHEFGTGIHFTKKQFTIQSLVSVFQRQLNNWIIWLPVNSFIWSPQNLLQVNSNGFETETSVIYQKEKTKLKLLVNTNYVVSQNVKSVNENDESVNRQLIYTPMYNGSATILFTYSKFTALYNYTYIGYRYTSTDNFEYLTPYQLSNISLSYSSKIKKNEYSIFVRCNNVFNENYQVVRNYATPIRNYNVGIQINLNNSKHEKNNYTNQ